MKWKARRGRRVDGEERKGGRAGWVKGRRARKEGSHERSLRPSYLCVPAARTLIVRVAPRTSVSLLDRAGREAHAAVLRLPAIEERGLDVCVVVGRPGALALEVAAGVALRARDLRRLATELTVARTVGRARFEREWIRVIPTRE